MKRSLSEDFVDSITAKLQVSNREFNDAYPGNSAQRQPVHTVYGGAHLFKENTIEKVGTIARQSFSRYARNHEALSRALSLSDESEDMLARLHTAVVAKLETEPVEDYRIDFEDGYGIRSNDEEDAHAAESARAYAAAFQKGALPPFSGIRVKSFCDETVARSIRTADVFLTEFVQSLGEAVLPPNFAITLPKVVTIDQVKHFVECLDTLESALGLISAEISIELMVESPQSLMSTGGELVVSQMVSAAAGRCRSVHFGAYDFTAACDISASQQRLSHPLCTFARAVMKTGLAGTGVWLSDGATTTIPLGPHKEGQNPLSDQMITENTRAVHRAWAVSFQDVLNSLDQGFYQGWDLHPAQIPIRYCAVYYFFLKNAPEAARRFKAFVDKAAQATLAGQSFDDAATGQGLLNFFLRATACGALTRQDMAAYGVAHDQLESRSFVKILQAQAEKSSANS